MTFNKKRILFVTSTRADYGKIKSLIIKIQKNKKFLSKVFVTGMHNLQLYGRTIGELKVDKISGLIIHNNQNKFSKMDEILINTIRGFSPVLKKFKPDLVVIHGDRTEPLACALSALLNNFNVVHIEGGEVSGTVLVEEYSIGIYNSDVNELDTSNEYYYDSTNANYDQVVNFNATKE